VDLQRLLKRDIFRKSFSLGLKWTNWKCPQEPLLCPSSHCFAYVGVVRSFGDIA